MSINKRLDPQNYFDEVEVYGAKETNLLDRIPLDYEFDTLSGVFRIKSRHVGRFDIISDEAYGDSAFDWILMLANNIDDPHAVEAGQEIELPEIDEIFDFLEQYRR